MKTSRLRKLIIIVSSLTMILIVCFYNWNSQEETIVGNFTKPIINVNGQLYGTCIVENKEIAKEYNLYGYVESSVKEKIGIPGKDLQVTEIMKDNIGYKVYISQDKKFVAIFNEEMQEFNYYEKE